MELKRVMVADDIFFFLPYQCLKFRIHTHWPVSSSVVVRPCQGGSHVTRLDFKTSRVGVYKCLSLIVSFAVTVAIWPGEVVSCHDFIVRAVATFWAVSLVGIYPGRTSVVVITF